MKVLHISNDYFHSTVYKNLHTHLLKFGIESFFIVPMNKKEKTFTEEKNLFQLKCYNSFDKYTFLFRYLKTNYAISKIHCLIKPNIIHAHFLFSAGIVALHIYKKYKTPYIVAIRNTDMKLLYKSFIHRMIGISISLHAKKIVFINQSYRDKFINDILPLKYRKLLEDKLEVIPNGIDNYWIDNRCYRNSFEKTNTIITIGEVNSNKNQLGVAELINKYLDYNYRYIVVGEVTEQKVYETLIKNNNVQYIKKQPKERLREIFKLADIFVLLSHNETFGLVYAEALSQGLPILYTKGQGFDKQFEDGIIGYSVDLDTEKDFIDKFIMINKNYKTLSYNATKLVDKFSWDSISYRYINLYTLILH